MKEKEELIIIPINVKAKETLVPFITEFTDNGGIYDNINSGILQEPLMPKYLTMLLGYEVVKHEGPIVKGSDYHCPSNGEEIEHKSATLSKNNTAELTGISEVKRKSKYISFYVRSTHMLYVVDTAVILDLCELRDMGNDKFLGFHADMVVDNKNNRLSNNTRILAKYVRAINIETGKIYENPNQFRRLF